MHERYEILVLDDESIVCERLSDHFQKKGYGVESFTESETALQRLQEKRFDVVITDLKMVGLDGIDVLITIRKKHLPIEVIIITGYPDYESKRIAEFKDAFDYITKPFKMEELEKKVQKAAKKARKAGKRWLRKIPLKASSQG